MIKSSKSNLNILLAPIASLTLLASCSSHPIVPEAKNVKVSRENADEDCQDLGRVQGSVKTSTGTIEQAIEDMKLDAARKGANYVRLEAAGAMGTSAAGTAYFCR